MMHLLPQEKRLKSQWSQEDLGQKQEILQTLFVKLNTIAAKELEPLIDFLVDCSENKSSKNEISQLFESASKKSVSSEGFISFFSWLKPLDAKMIPFNMHSLGLKPWPNLPTAQVLATNSQDLLEQYFKDSDIPAAISLSDRENNTIHITSDDIYPIHSIAKIFTGIVIFRLMEEKPDGENSILTEKMLKKPIKELLAPDSWSLLPPVLRHYLKSNMINLTQLMTHQSGLGDYGYDRGKGTYRESLEKGTDVTVNEIKDFLQFAEQTIYPSPHYSNLGFTLVGLAAEHIYNSYQKNHPSLKPLNFFGILKKYILDEAKIVNFFAKAPTSSSYHVQVNHEDSVALAWVGGPAGGYWTSTGELVKFGKWLYEKCKSPEFKALVEQFGKEFYYEGTISHPGTSLFSSAFFSVDLTTGKIVTVASTHQSAVPLGLELGLGNRIFMGSKIKEESTITASEKQTQLQTTSPKTTTY
ncbi:serine hydrolase domain-containing protein [Legionella brunensis]|nr:serine hydrolase domain-containing protein [Legionella brunensis]